MNESAPSVISRDDYVKKVAEKRLPELIPELGKEISRVTIDEGIIPAITAWKAGSLKTICDMDCAMRNNTQKCLTTDSLKGQIEDIVRAWVRGVGDDIRSEINFSHTEYGAQAETVRLLDAGVGNLSLLMSEPELLDKLYTKIEDVQTTIASMIFGILKSSIPYDPFVITIGTLVSIASWFIGKKRMIMSLDMPMYIRQIIDIDYVITDKKRGQIADEVSESIANNLRLKALIIKSISDELYSYLTGMKNKTDV